LFVSGTLTRSSSDTLLDDGSDERIAPIVPGSKFTGSNRMDLDSYPVFEFDIVRNVEQLVVEGGLVGVIGDYRENIHVTVGLRSDPGDRAEEIECVDGGIEVVTNSLEEDRRSLTVWVELGSVDDEAPVLWFSGVSSVTTASSFRSRRVSMTRSRSSVTAQYGSRWRTSPRSFNRVKLVPTVSGFASMASAISTSICAIVVFDEKSDNALARRLSFEIRRVLEALNVDRHVL